MKLQEAFDISAAHLLRQNARAIEGAPQGRGRCRYRTEDGRKCAIGVLMPDALYREAFENHSIWEVMMMSPEFKHHIMDGSSHTAPMGELLEDLRAVHDHVATCEWRPALHALAVTHGLTADVLAHTKREVA